MEKNSGSQKCTMSVLQNEIRNLWKTGVWLLLPASILLFFLSFFFWPATIHISPLDRFLLGTYPLWLLVMLFFVLGVITELLPVGAFIYLYPRWIFPTLVEEGTSRTYYLKAIVGVLLSMLPVIMVFFLAQTEEAFRPNNHLLGLLLLRLARFQGYQGSYYHEHLALAVSEWFYAGGFFTLALGVIHVSRKLQHHVTLPDFSDTFEGSLMESKKAQNGKGERVPSGYMLSLIGGILIEVPFVLILAPLFTFLFVEAFLSPFFYVPGVVVTILSYFGLLAGILVLIGSWLIKTGRSKAGGIIVIIFSLSSIVSGGGFIIGLVLGVVGGMAGIVGKQK